MYSLAQLVDIYIYLKGDLNLQLEAGWFVGRNVRWRR